MPETVRSISSGTIFPQKQTYHLMLHDQRTVQAYDVHRHEGFGEFVFVREGNIRHTINGQDFMQGPGCLTFIRAQDEHGVTILAGAKMNNLAFLLEFLADPRFRDGTPQCQDVIADLLIQEMPPQTVVCTPKREVLTAAFDRLLLYRDTSYERLMFQEFLFALFAQYLVVFPQVRERAPGMPDWLAACLSFIERNPEQDFSLEELVALGGRTHEHTSRLFRRFLGMSPSQYLNGMRLARAANLLRGTNLPVLDIGRRVGFQNANYFHSLFRARYGLTPVGFRTANREPGHL